MAPIRVDKALADKYDAIKEGHVQPPGYLRSAFTWIMDSDYRKAVDVSKWLAAQTSRRDNEVSYCARQISSKKDVDSRAHEAKMLVWNLTE